MSQRKIPNGNKKGKTKDVKKDKIVMMMKNYKTDRTLTMNHKKDKIKNYVKKKVMNHGKSIIQMMKRIKYKIYKMGNNKKDNMLLKKIKTKIVLKDTTCLKGRDEKKTTKKTKDNTLLEDKKENEKLKAQYEEVLKLFYKLTPELRSQRVTRSISQVVNHYSKFVILEDYRCMPLLGDEDAVPYWEVHVCKYSLVFVV